MQELSVPQSPQNTAVRCWLIGVAALIALMVLVGGATRLTESGLSIVEWKPVTGIAAAADRCAMARGVRGLQANPAISRAQCRHDAGAVQDHLLVGMEPSPARALHRRRLSAAVPLFPLARRAGRGTETAAVADLRSRRAAGRGRLVDGRFRPDAANGSIAVSARGASDAGAGDFRRHRLDGAADERATGHGGAAAAETVQPAAAWIDVPADLFRRAGRGPARRARVQYMA